MEKIMDKEMRLHQTGSIWSGTTMKHLLIILSILILSFPLFADNHKGETLYAWGECCDWVWKGFGDKETHSVYKGQVTVSYTHLTLPTIYSV